MASYLLFPQRFPPTGHQVELKTVWQKSLRRAKVPYLRIYHLRSTYATRLSAGGVADEWVTQLLRQGDSQVFKRYSQMKLQMKREALEKINRQANEMPLDSGTAMVQLKSKLDWWSIIFVGKCFIIITYFMSGRSAAW
jgi:hypothetical protein